MPHQGSNSFGEALRHFRVERNGWSREKAAAEIGVTVSAYGRFEAGSDQHKNPTKKIVEKYAAGLMAPLSELLVAAGYTAEDSGTPGKVLNSVTEWRLTRLPPEQLKMAEEYISLLYEHCMAMDTLKKEEAKEKTRRPSNQGGQLPLEDV